MATEGSGVGVSRVAGVAPRHLQCGTGRSRLGMGVGSVWGPSSSRARMEQWAWKNVTHGGKTTGKPPSFC